jgi:hypothetical protein
MSRRLRAFSLLELMVAIVIITTLVGTMTGFVFDVLRTRDALDLITGRERAAGVLFDTLERDLQTVIATGPDGRSGVRGDASSLRIAVASTPVRLAVPGRGAQALGTVDWLDVRFDAGSRSVRLRRESVRGGDALAVPADSAAAPDLVDVEPEVGFDEPFADEAFGGPPDAAPAVDPDAIGGAFFLVEFRYHDGSGWRSSFDSAGAGLPVAIEISVWFDPWLGALDEAADGAATADDATFDGNPAFDDPDEAFGDPSAFTVAEDGFADAETERPLPDRRRIIAIPDARAGEAAGGFGGPASDSAAGPESGP